MSKPLSVSVISPSYNQAEFLPRMFSSVSQQTLQPSEHLVFDPGSTDGSRDIAAATENVTLIAESDSGQADAVARGMLEASGDIIAWLNSDDEYYDDTVFSDVAEAFASDEKPDIVFGEGIYVGKTGEFLRDAYVMQNPAEMSWRLAKEVGILQPATFISKKLIDKIGPVDRDLQFCMDYEFWVRAHQSGAKFLRLNRPLARARYYADNKTLGQRDRSIIEVIHMLKRRFGFAHYQWVKCLADFQINGNDGILKHFSTTDVDAALLEMRTHELLLAINGDYNATQRIKAEQNTKLPGKTVDIFKEEYGHHSAVYSRPIAEESAPPPNTQCYTVGPQRWAFNRTWLNETTLLKDYIRTAKAMFAS